MKKEIPPAWGTIYDKNGENTGEFIASREGLAYFREKIDEALKNGESAIGSDADFDFMKIVVADTHPLLVPETPGSFWSKIIGYVFLSLIAIFILFAIYGCHSFIELIKK